MQVQGRRPARVSDRFPVQTVTIADVEMTTHQRFHGNRFGSHEATQSPGGSCEGRQVADIRICRDEVEDS
jgi:hypothetical protein